MSEVIDQFCDHHFAANRITPARQTQMRRLLREFEDSLGGRQITEATALDFETWLTDRLQSLTPATVKRQQYTVRPFFVWAARHGFVTREQHLSIKEVPAPRGVKHTPNPYSRAELERLWAMLDARFPFTDQETVDRWLKGRSMRWRREVKLHVERLQYEAMIACALYGGMRRGEIFRLELDDLHEDHATLPARSRKNSEGVWVMRAIPIIEPMEQAFAAWTVARERLQAHITAPPEAPWIRLQYGRGFGVKLDEGKWRGKGEGHLARIHREDYHGKLRWGFHRLRHTCATEMLRNDYKLHVVREILGHSSLEQTLRYAELLDADILRESERASPRFARAIARTRNGHGP